MFPRATSALMLLLSVISLLAGAASGEWAFSAAWSYPPSPDHEQPSTFFAMLVYGNGSANQTGDQNATGNNGTGTNATGSNATAANITVNITHVQVVLGVNSTRPRSTEQRSNLTRQNGTDRFSIRLGPWAPGEELPYHFEAFLSNGSVLRTNESWLRTPEIMSFKWHESYDEAVALARSLGRPLLVFVYSDNDHSSEYMFTGPFSAPAALALSAGFVCLRVDADTEPDLARQLKVAEAPGLVFLNASSGRTLDRVSGQFDSDKLVKEMRYILGKGPEPGKPGPFVLDIAVGVIALGVVLAGGSLLMYYYYFNKNRKER